MYIQTSTVVLNPMRTASLYKKPYSVSLNTPENKGNTFVPNVGNFSSIDKSEDWNPQPFSSPVAEVFLELGT